MTTETELAPEFRPIAVRLEGAGSQFRLGRLLAGMGQWLAAAITTFVAAFFLAGYFQLPGWVNVAILVAVAASLIWAYLAYLHAPLWQRPTYGQIARWVEENGAAQGVELHNEFINAVLLAQQTGNHNRPLSDALLSELDDATAHVELGATVPWKTYRKAIYRSLLLVAICLVPVFAKTSVFVHGARVLAHPMHFVPVTGSVRIISVEPGNDVVLAGQAVNFSVKVEAPNQNVVDAQITLKFAGGKVATYPMNVFGSDNTQYRYTLTTAAEDAEYVITAGDSQSERYRLQVMPQIHMMSYQLSITPPAYTGKEASKVTLSGKDMSAARASCEVPIGSRLEITAAVDIPMKEAITEIQGVQPAGMIPSADAKNFSTSFTIRKDIKYAVRFNDGNGRTLLRFPEESSGQAGDFISVRAVADEAPTVVVSEPGRDVDAKPGQSVALGVQANDDYGLTELRLELARGKDGEFAIAKSWPIKAGADGKPAKAATMRYLLELPADQYKFGDIVRYRFVAVDNRVITDATPAMGPQVTQGQVFSITLNDAAAAAARSGKLWEELHKKINELRDQQIALRTQTDGVAAAKGMPVIKDIAVNVAKGQQSLQKKIKDLAANFPFESGMKMIQKALQVLSVEDAATAIDRANDLSALSDLKTVPPMAMKLRTTQSRIIDVLDSLLAIAAAQEEKAKSAADKDGGDLPMTPAEAWKKLADDLKDFAKQQQKVIDTSAELAKKPKDDFTKEDEEKLKNLIATEDKWEKFLSQRIADMSKIAEQDQANVSLMEELVQMKVELAMAKDALQNKQMEIATSLEDNGLESAKELTTHLERWLQQEPDRKQWQMEEPLTQNDQNMAELPKQLQDMVSDLMDSEEDVTEEMEDLGSKWADSLDKGAGWDAMDGPISNMSAQGVTGNQLPNNNEIQGRSGEGREGRASGEMVGAEAEGKGGRRTPTRMTPEPFSNGKVDDKSKEPAGGATGGGKKAGFGGEGLEGPAPLEMQDPMQRLAGKQAELRNQAERLQLQMRQAGYQNFKLLESAVLMQKAEKSMKEFHYQNALYYQRQAVQSLNSAKVLAEGQVHVTMDTTPTASEKTQKDIDNAMQGAMPKGYSDPVKAYFEKLSQQGNADGQ